MAADRGRFGDGAVYKTSAGDYRGTVDLGRDPKTGRRVRKYVRGKTKGEAIKKVAEERDKHRAGELTVQTRKSLAEYAEGVRSESYATGILGRRDLLTGELTLVNAGHVAPYLARGDDVRHLDLPRDLPLGIFADAPYRATTVALEPATGSYWSPTGCSSATPLTSASWAASARPGRCTPAR